MTSEHSIRPGDVLAGKYRVERFLGEGGMGFVVAAQHLQLDERVALKFLHRNALENTDTVARFAREARAAAKIKSEHVARVTDVGQLEDGAPFIVMEYLEGTDLSAWLKQRGALAAVQAVDFVLQASEALAEAHGLGIIHRDLKPANLFCIQRADGRPLIKVLDFGISKMATEGAADMTRTSTMIGSPQYMSPEQMRSSKGVDTRTDIWSLGTILFELLAGCAPFRASTITELAIVVANEPPPSLRVLRPALPPGLEEQVLRSLEKDRARRFQTVGELAIALEPFGSADGRASVERVIATLHRAGLGAKDPARSTPSLSGAAASPRSERDDKSAPAAGDMVNTALDPARADDAVTSRPPAAEWGRTSSRRPHGPERASARRGAPWVVAAALALAVASAGLWFVRPGPKVVATEPAPSPGLPVALPSAVVVAATTVRAPKDTEHEAPAPAAADASVAPGTVEVDASVAPSAPSTVHARPPSHAAPREKPADCDPPYSVNAKGSRVFKKECL